MVMELLSLSESVGRLSGCLASSGGWRFVVDGEELILDSPWAGEYASLSRPADVARLLSFDGDPASAGACVACMLSGLLSEWLTERRSER